MIASLKNLKQRIVDKLRKSIKQFIGNRDWKDIWIRSKKTFFEIAITYVLSALAGVNFSKDLGETFWMGLLLSAGSMGVCAVWNTVIRPTFKTESDDNIEAQLRTVTTSYAKKSAALPEKEDING